MREAQRDCNALAYDGVTVGCELKGNTVMLAAFMVLDGVIVQGNNKFAKPASHPAAVVGGSVR